MRCKLVMGAWNNASTFILDGKDGGFAINRCKEQEVFMLVIHLLQVGLVHINTLMMQQVFAEADWQGRLTDADLQALTSLKWQHINPYETFTLNIDERLPRGQSTA